MLTMPALFPAAAAAAAEEGRGILDHFGMYRKANCTHRLRVEASGHMLQIVVVDGDGGLGAHGKSQSVGNGRARD